MASRLGRQWGMGWHLAQAHPMGWPRGQDSWTCQSFDLQELVAEESEARAHILRSPEVWSPGSLQAASGPSLLTGVGVGKTGLFFTLSLLFKQ